MINREKQTKNAVGYKEPKEHVYKASSNVKGDMKYLICCNFFPLNFTRLADFDYLVPNHNLGK